MPIKVLDQKVVAQIAAGEVVERPASVVKELVENSLDASAREIAIETEGGGVSLIRVGDNGVGIPVGEVALAFERHATSKIAHLEDLMSLSSLGFRGEALPSIAAVAQVEIVTCARGESAGSYLSLNEGTIVNQGSQGHPAGTTITVRHLFRSVPARLKFLKSPATENSHIANVVSQYALAFPEVKFILTIDGRTVLRTSGSGRLIDSVAQVYGLETARNMLELGQGDVGWETGGASSSLVVTGMVGTPAISRSSRGHLSFFVNRRWVNSRLLSWAVEEAYHGLLMVGKHPLAILNIGLSLQEVDVNVHPTKTEVKFQKEGQVFSAVERAVRRALVAETPVPRIEEVATSYRSSPALYQVPGSAVDNFDPLSGRSTPAHPTPLFALPALRLLGQLASSYLVAEGPDGLYLIDQHAAHERILFEKLKHQSLQQQVEVQGLLEPVPFEVNLRQEAILKSYYPSLAEFGFSLEPFGERIYLVRAVPALLHQGDWRGALQELLEASLAGDKTDWREKVVIAIACHSATRAGQVLSSDEMRDLLRQLEQVAVPATCPHGRPVMMHLSSGQLEREFGRS